MKYVFIGLLALIVSACANNPPAPVVERTAQPVKQKSASTVKPQSNKPPSKVSSNNDWRPDYHVVKKGDTLISIGLEYGYYYKDIALANNINAPFIIKIGQQINLSSISSKINGGETTNPVSDQVEDGVVLTPITSDPVLGNETIMPKDESIATKSIGKDKPTADTKVAILVPALSEPKAVREPYSLAAMNRMEPVQNHQNSKNNSKNVAGKPLEPILNEVKPAINKPIEPKVINAKPTDPKPDVAVDVTKGVAKDLKSGEASTEPGGPTDNDVKPVDVQAVQWSWPTKGKVIASFNEATNKGLDIAGETGQAINAASAGKVIYSGSDLRGYGKLVIIKHNKTFLSVYAHNSKIIVKEGQIVASGQKIAEMGDTDSSIVKLHFEIRRLGKSVNPAPYFN